MRQEFWMSPVTCYLPSREVDDQNLERNMFRNFVAVLICVGFFVRVSRAKTIPELDDERSGRWFGYRYTITVTQQEEVTSLIPSSCVHVEPSLPACRSVRTLNSFPRFVGSQRYNGLASYSRAAISTGFELGVEIILRGMSGSIGAFGRYFFSPRLYKHYSPNEKDYVASNVEHYADQIINAISVMWKVGIYTSPIIIGILYKKGIFTCPDSMLSLGKLATGIGVILIVAYFVRGIGRANNPMYAQFLAILDQTQFNATKLAIRSLSQYDFEFFAWPVEFEAKDVLEIEGDRYDQHRIYIHSPPNLSSSASFLSTPLGAFLRPPLHLLGYLATHSFGIRLLYPGQLQLVQAMTRASCAQGRTWLVQMQRGQRAKIRARDGNDIDTMFVDKRHNATNGNVLVICCEGNAGYYEMGIMATPIQAEYSVLGWNHPGFGGSTGVPYPTQEQNAIEIVMQYAMYKLQFPIENILLFGWSIGGYTATWAAMNFPKVKGIILDASFDDLMPLALNHMPSWADSIVRLAVREYVNLNHYEQLSMYAGPVLIIRRTLDEVIAINENDISSNRCNYLLTKLMKYRYPQIFDETVMKIINDYIALNPTAVQEFVRPYTINHDLCRQQLESYVSEHGKTFPQDIGDSWTAERKIPLALYLVRKYFKDHVSTHCAPLPVDMFQIPWDINVESGYVMP